VWTTLFDLLLIKLVFIIEFIVVELFIVIIVELFVVVIIEFKFQLVF